MILLDPRHPEVSENDAPTNELMRETIAFFEAKGKQRLIGDYYERRWYSDFLEYAKEHRLLATMCTPAVCTICYYCYCVEVRRKLPEHLCGDAF